MLCRTAVVGYGVGKNQLSSHRLIKFINFRPLLCHLDRISFAIHLQRMKPFSTHTININSKSLLFVLAKRRRLLHHWLLSSTPVFVCKFKWNNIERLSTIFERSSDRRIGLTPELVALQSFTFHCSELQNRLLIHNL